MTGILIVEYDDVERIALTRDLSGLGYCAFSASTVAHAVQEVATGKTNLVLLNLGSSDLNGTTALRMIRRVSEIPIIVVTVRGDDASMVRLLNAGVDDYITGRRSKELLAARIEAVLRRTKQQFQRSETLTVGELRIERVARTVYLADRQIDLNRRVFDLLVYLAQNANRVVSRNALLTNIWVNPDHRTDRTLDVHISLLRGRLGETAAKPRYLHTLRGIGFRLAIPHPTGLGSAMS